MRSLAWLLVLPGVVAPLQEETWESRREGGFTIRFTAGDAGEIGTVVALLKTFEASFCKAGRTDPASFAAIRVTLELHPRTSKEIGLGYASLEGGLWTANGTVSYVGTIRMAGPAAHDGTQTSTSGHPKDRNFFDKLLIHEVAPAYLELLAHARGLKFNGAFPDWFEQGVEEYLGVFHSTPYWREEGLRCYHRRLKKDPSSIDTAFGLNLCDPYNDGFIILNHLRDDYGEETVFRILGASEKEFGRKLQGAVGGTFDEFLRRFENWRRTRIDGGEVK